MTRTLLLIFLSVFALSVPASSFSAEAVRLRYGSSIYFDAAGKGLKWPEGVAYSEKAFLIVSDTGNGRLLKYTFQDNILKGGDELKVPEVSYPLRVQINSAGDIFVLDGKQRRIARVGSDGNFKQYLEPAGIPSPAALVPRSFKIDRNDNIYLLDIFSERVLVLDQTGKYIRHIAFPEKYGFISDLAVDAGGTVFLLDSVDALVYSAAADAKGFSPLSGSLEEYMNFPVNMTTDSRGNLYLADQNGSGVIVLGRDGSFQGRLVAFGWKEGLLRYPSQLSITEKGELFIADKENNRIQIFTVVK